jgi:hypothetical protein
MGDIYIVIISSMLSGFHDSNKVLLALIAFHETIVSGHRSDVLTNQKLMELFKVMLYL